MFSVDETLSSKDCFILIVAKSPTIKSWTSWRGRVGPLTYQDWYRTCVLAKEIVDKNPRAKILLVTAFKDKKEPWSEMDYYLKVLADLGVPNSKVVQVHEGFETIGQLEFASAYSNGLGRSLILVATASHFLRILYLLWKSKGQISALSLHVPWFGLPRPKELITDILLTILFPVIDVFGFRDKFLSWLVEDRIKGKI